MDVIRRIGTQKKKFKIQFFLGRLKFSAFLSGKITIVIKRGNKKLRSQKKIQMSKDLKLNFEKQMLEMQNTLYFDQKQNKYLQKQGQIRVILIGQNQDDRTQLGIVKFDLAQYANKGQVSTNQKKQLQQTPKKLQGLIQYNIFVKYIGQGSESSFDKVSNFFFGKDNSNIKEKQTKSDKNLLQDNKFTTKKGSEQDKRNQIGKMKRELSDQKQQEYQRQKQKSNLKKTVKAKQFYSHNFNTQTKIDIKNKKDKQKRRKSQQEEQIVGRRSSQQQINQFQEKGKNYVQINNKLRNKQENEQYKPKISKNNFYFDQPQIKNQNTQKINQNNNNCLKLQSQINKQKQQIQLWKKKYEQQLIEKQKKQKLIQNYIKQNKLLSQQNNQLSSQLKQNQKIILKLQQNKKSKNEDQDQDPFKIQANKKNEEITQKYQKQIKILQKEKSQLLVQLSKLKQKYKNDIKKYQTIFAQKQQTQMNSSKNIKLEQKKIKEQLTEMRQKIEKLKKQKQGKIIQCNNYKNQKTNLQQQVTDLRTILAKLKLKIGTLINEAMNKKEDYVVQLLSRLSQN